MTQQQSRTTLRVFVSYASDDRWFATPLLDRLAKHPGVSVFATQNLSAAEDWRKRLKQELVAASAFLVLLSPRSVESNWVLSELGAAWALGKPIVAVLTDPAVRSKIPVEARQLSFLHIPDPTEPDIVDRIIERLGENYDAHPGAGSHDT